MSSADQPAAPVGEAVLTALRAHPGVSSADLNVPLSRVVVTLTEDRPTLGEICEIVDAAEDLATAHSYGRERVPDLPGDGVVMIGHLATVTANGVGLGVAVAGRALRWPALPAMFLATFDSHTGVQHRRSP